MTFAAGGNQGSCHRQRAVSRNDDADRRCARLRRRHAGHRRYEQHPFRAGVIDRAAGGHYDASGDRLEPRASLVGWWCRWSAAIPPRWSSSPARSRFRLAPLRRTRRSLGNAPGTATVVASSPNFASASAQTTTQGNLNITVSSIQIRPAFPSTVTVELQSAGSPVAAPAPGVPVSFVASVPGCAAIASVTIPTGLTSATAAVTYGGSATLPCTTTVNANAAEFDRRQHLRDGEPEPGHNAAEPAGAGRRRSDDEWLHGAAGLSRITAA